MSAVNAVSPTKAASSAEILLDGDHASQVRDYAAKLAEKEQGMKEMSAKFRALGAKVYVEEDGRTRS